MSLAALELGGSHVSAGRLGDDGTRLEPGTFVRHALAPDGSRAELLSTIGEVAAATAVEGIAGWGVATPGPFDYARGICTIRGVGKLDALYGVDLRAELARRTGLQSDRIVFLNDADAFLLGEWIAGRARGYRRAMGVTLGTGLGSAFLVDGRIVEEGRGVPAEGRLDLVAYRGRPAEESISARGLMAGYERGVPDAATIAARALAAEPEARAAIARFASALGEFLDPWIEGFAPGCLVIGGSIARSWELFADAFAAAAPASRRLADCGPAEQLDAAALLGAGRHARRAIGD